MGYVDGAFAKLKSTLEIGKTEQSLAVRRHHEVRDHVRASWPSRRTSSPGATDATPRRSA